jgi:hypothetical protein
LIEARCLTTTKTVQGKLDRMASVLKGCLIHVVYRYAEISLDRGISILTEEPP